MKTSIGATQLFMIVITIILLMTGFFCLSINYTSAYKVSDAIVQQIKYDNGFNTDNVVEVLKKYKYAQSANCGDGWDGFRLDGTRSTGDKANFCIRKVMIFDSGNSEELPDMYYYQVKVFYNVDAPFFSRFGFYVKGDTPNIYKPKDELSGNLNVYTDNNSN